jgi:hypothetical protein
MAKVGPTMGRKMAEQLIGRQRLGVVVLLCCLLLQASLVRLDLRCLA